jgi:tRNA(Ile)-lysidine synthase
MHRLAEVHEIYSASIALQIKKLCVQKGMEYHIPVLKLQQSKTLSTLVFEIIRQFNFSSAQVNEVVQLLQSETGKYMSSSTHRILKNRNWIIISSLPTLEQSHILVERESLSIRYPHGQLQFNFENIEATPVFSTNLLEATINANILEYPLIVRQWKTGDYFYPLGMKKKKKLSRFMIDQKLSLIQKEKIWVLESNKRIVWVIGQRIDDRFKVTAQTQQILTIQLRVSE